MAGVYGVSAKAFQSHREAKLSPEMLHVSCVTMHYAINYIDALKQIKDYPAHCLYKQLRSPYLSVLSESCSKKQLVVPSVCPPSSSSLFSVTFNQVVHYRETDCKSLCGWKRL